jgi:hypothetical protein
MNRSDVWITFAMGAAGQFPTGRQAAAYADELLEEFEARFYEENAAGARHIKEEHPSWRARAARA